MDPSMRKRGWSITSNDYTIESPKSQNDQNMPRRNRARSNTDHSEVSLTTDEKMELMNSFPTEIIELDQEGEDEEKGHEKEEEDHLEMFGDSDDDNDDDSCKPTTKKQRLISKEDENGSKSKGGIDPKLLELAKGRLSKWATRLFDPNRPRGLVQAPEIIPLNDEFLTQFGQANKEMQDVTGQKLDIDRGNLDQEIEEETNDGGKKQEEKQKSAKDGFKVKVTNLAYTTSLQSLTRKMESFGPLLGVNLNMDEKNPRLSVGRAFVIFESKHDQETCISTLHDKPFEGRALRVNSMDESSRRKSFQPSGGGAASNASRYYIRDITTKCFRCGQIGHRSDSCPNEQLAKPCPLCAKTGHDSWSCPLAKICFNCGIPGHINRECPERRGMPQRLVCSTCFRSHHHRWRCPERIHNISSWNARCMSCGKEGHFMCGEMRWFFGLQGLTCFNCGGNDHHGLNCDRPGISVCARNADIAAKEVERAEIISFEEEVANHQEQNRRRDKGKRRKGREERDGRDNSRGRSPDRGQYDRRRDRHSDLNRKESRIRAKSQPPNTNYRAQNQVSSYGSMRSHRSSSRDHSSGRSRGSRGSNRGYR